MRTFSRLLVILALVAPTAAAAQSKPLQGLDDYVTKSMADWKIPGLALAIVRNDSVILAKGYGVRTLGKPRPGGRAHAVRHRVFLQGLHRRWRWRCWWTRARSSGTIRPRKYLPGFQLYDPYVTREITVRDLLSHRSGLARGDMLWYAAQDLPRDSILHHVRYLKPTLEPALPLRLPEHHVPRRRPAGRPGQRQDPGTR